MKAALYPNALLFCPNNVACLTCFMRVLLTTGRKSLLAIGKAANSKPVAGGPALPDEYRRYHEKAFVTCLALLQL